MSMENERTNRRYKTKSPRQELINSQHALDEEYKYNFDSFCTFVFKVFKRRNSSYF